MSPTSSILALLLLLSPSTALAQDTAAASGSEEPASVEANAAIRVTVYDAEQFEVPNARVTLTGATLPRPLVATTSDLGMVLFEIPPGIYDIEVESAAGVAAIQGVEARAKRTVNPIVMLTTAEEVRVLAREKAVDTESTEKGSVLTKDFLARVPRGRTYQTAVQTSAGVAVGAGQRGATNIAGAATNGRYAPTRVNQPAFTDLDAKSTFSVDVDTASFTFGRTQLEHGRLPPPASVRVEEYVNAIGYDYPRTTKGPPLQAHLAATSHPTRPDRHILRVGLQGRAYSGVRRPVHLTFLVDVSGSMSSPGKLDQAREALHRLVDELGNEDTVAIATYAGSSEIVLQPTWTTQRKRMHAAIDALSSSGGTNMGDGMQLAYEMAEAAFLPGCENRVIVLSDGDANIGHTGHHAILRQIRDHADRGITMTTIGFGHQGYNDQMMEQLANQGDGNYHFIADERDADRVFGRHLTSTIETLARDVKVQVDFDPDAVLEYRLLGYENRDIADEDFEDDDVDAGEVGSGHQVTALYEVALAPWVLQTPELDTPIATTHVRYKPPGPDAPSSEDSWTLTAGQVGDTFDNADADLRLAWATATLAEKLRDSPFATSIDWDRIARIARDAADRADPEHDELLTVIRLAAELQPVR